MRKYLLNQKGSAQYFYKQKSIYFRCKSVSAFSINIFVYTFFRPLFLSTDNLSLLWTDKWGERWIQFSVRLLLFSNLIIGPYENLHQIRFWIAICFGMHFQDIPDFPNINIFRSEDINITTPIREQSLNQEYDIIVGIITRWRKN